MAPGPGRWKVLGVGEDGGYWDGSINMYISYVRFPSNFLAQPKAYLEQAPGCKTAADLAVAAAAAAAAEGVRRNPVRGAGSLGESVGAWHIGGRSVPEGVTWMTRAEPRSLS